jgi:hypothetical protein
MQHPIAARLQWQTVSAREFGPVIRHLRRLIDDCDVGLVRFFEILRDCTKNRGISARVGSTFASFHRDSD